MKRSTVALWILIAGIGVLAFYQTPLMARARLHTWEAITAASARIFRITDALPNETLNDRLQRLTADNLRLKAELQDYRRIRQELATPSVENTRPVPAVIIARPVDTLQSEFILSRGLMDGIAIGDPVVVFGSNLVGIIIETGSNTSRVRTLFHPDAHIPAEIVNEDIEIPPARGLLASSFYSSLSLTTIPRDITVAPGQSVVTVQDDLKMPYGLVIGTVESVENLEQEAYQSTRIMVPYDIDTISTVTVLTLP